MATDTETTEETEGEEMLSAKAAATLIGTDARTLRKFLRKKNGLVGQGQRWAIDPSDIDGLKEEFAAWNKGGDKPEKAAPTDEETFDEVEEDLLEELEDLEELDED